jgi:hypothetical protein
VVLIAVVPYALRGPWALVENVVAFPLGLAHVASPAASPLPGHLLATLWPEARRLVPPIIFLVGGVLLWRYVRRHHPSTYSDVLRIVAVILLVFTCAASATCFGYLIYPLNFWLWAALFEDRSEEALDTGRALVVAH